VADNTAAEKSSAAATTAGVAQATTAADRTSSAAPATRAATTASSEGVTAAEDVGIGTAVSVKAVATTAAALQERNKSVGRRKKVLCKGISSLSEEKSVFSDMQESPQKICDADNMNNRIQYKDSELQQEQFICSSCLSAHH
jgi:hypothetical protein